MPESPASSPRPFDFGDLGRPLPKSVRVLPSAPEAEASGQLEELSGDDIMESDDIDALEAAAAGIQTFEVDDDDATSLTSDAYVPSALAAAPEASEAIPAPEPSGFEVGDLGAFDEVQVEGVVRASVPAPAPAMMTGEAQQVHYARPVAAPAAAPAPAPAAMMMTGEAMQVHYAAPVAIAAIPAAPVTSPLPLEPVESVIVAEPIAERTLEIRGNDMAKVAAAAAKLDAPTAPTAPTADADGLDSPGHTEVLVRSAMPAALQTVRGGIQAPTPAPAPVQAQARPSSIAPVALDVGSLPRIPTRMGSMPAISIPLPPRMPSHAAIAPKRGMSGLAIGAIVFAAVAVVGTVGVGGFFASRALSDKSDSASISPSDTNVAPEPAAANGSQASGSIADPSGAASSPIDVSSLPAAPAPGTAPRGFTGKGTATFTPPAAPVPAAAPLAVAGGVVGSPAPASAPASAAGRSSGGALPAPGSAGASKVTSAPGAAGAPLAAPAAAAPAAAPPPKPANVATTGVVQVDPSLRAVIVDGSYRRANDGAVTVSCGSHRVKAGMKEQQTVNVPCGGSVSLF